MICVSLGRGRHRMMMAEHKHLAEQGAELVELRLDYIRRPVNMQRLLKERHCPVVITVRRPKDGGKWMRSESDRMTLIRTSIAEGVDYIDLEYDIASEVPRYGKTKRIISYHNFDETPKDLNKIHRMLAKLDPDVIKISTMANNPIDNIRVLRLIRDSAIPTIGFCMGEMGQMSRILCGRFGSPMTYATFHTERKMAPGQFTFEQMQNVYRYDEINQDTDILGVIADPVAHSFSPQVHNACLRAAGLNMLYLPFRVPKEYLEQFIEICPELGVRGLSVTIPHKETVLKCLNDLHDDVAGIKAANTVVFKGPMAYGFNTDCQAAIDSLRTVLESHPDLPMQIPDAKFCIMGAGGVARAIAFGLTRQGADVTITARDHRKAEELAKELECKTLDWPMRNTNKANVLINCTPVGMHPDMDETPFAAEWLDRNAIVFDTIYNPEQTLLIKSARQAGCITITGVDMFVRQAAKQFRLFTEEEPDLKLIRHEVKRATSAAQY